MYKILVVLLVVAILAIAIEPALAGNGCHKERRCKPVCKVKHGRLICTMKCKWWKICNPTPLKPVTTPGEKSQPVEVGQRPGGR